MGSKRLLSFYSVVMLSYSHGMCSRYNCVLVFTSYVLHSSFTLSEERISDYIGISLSANIGTEILLVIRIMTCKCVFVTILDFKDNFSKLRWSLLVTSFTYHLHFLKTEYRYQYHQISALKYYWLSEYLNVLNVISLQYLTLKIIFLNCDDLYLLLPSLIIYTF